MARGLTYNGVASPLFYRITQWLLAPGAERRIAEMIRERLAQWPASGRILDVGCGPFSRLWRAGLHPVGLDLSFVFAAALHRVGEPGVNGSAETLPFPDDCFAAVWSFGLIHHLPDDVARRAVREMIRVTKPGGQTVIFDAVLPEPAWRRPVAWLLRRLDRGAWMRRQQSLLAVLAQPRAWTCERMTYALTGLEGLYCAYQKPRQGE